MGSIPLTILLLGGCFLFCSFPGNGADDTQIFQTRALQSWMQVGFLDPFSKYHHPPTDRVEEGSKIHDRVKLSGFDGLGKSGIVQEASLKSLGDILNIWSQQGIVNEEEVRDMKLILADETMFKTVREYAHVSNGRIIFGVYGLIKLSNKEEQQSERKGSLYYSFRIFKLNSENMGVSYNKGQSCIIWGILCPTIFQFNGLDDSESENLASFMLSEALNEFDNENQIKHLRSTAKNYEPFLPDDVKQGLAEMAKEGDTRPDQILEKDPLDGNNFDL